MWQPTHRKKGFRRAEDSPGFMLWRSSNLLQRMQGRRLRNFAVTPGQFSFMACLVYLHQFEPVTAARVVAYTVMDKMMVSDLVKVLERKRLLTKRPDPKDARALLIEPTPLGIDITNDAADRMESLDARFFRRARNPATFHAELIALVERANCAHELPGQIMSGHYVPALCLHFPGALAPPGRCATLSPFGYTDAAVTLEASPCRSISIPAIGCTRSSLRALP